MNKIILFCAIFLQSCSQFSAPIDIDLKNTSGQKIEKVRIFGLEYRDQIESNIENGESRKLWYNSRSEGVLRIEVYQNNSNRIREIGYFSPGLSYRCEVYLEKETVVSECRS